MASEKVVELIVGAAFHFILRKKAQFLNSLHARPEFGIFQFFTA